MRVAEVLIPGDVEMGSVNSIFYGEPDSLVW